MIGRARLLRLVAIAGAMIVLPAAQAAAQDEAFKRAMDARGERKWGEVVDWLRQAIAEDSKESSRTVGARFGRVFGGGTRYLPHYFIGEAYFEQGNCAAAVTAWTTSQNQGVVHREREYSAIMQKGLSACVARGILLPAEYAKALSSVDQSLKTAGTAATRVSQYGGQHLDVWQSRPEWNADYGRASRTIEQAGRQLQSAIGTRLQKDFDAAKNLADSATTALLELERTLTAAVAAAGSLRAEIGNLRQAVDEALELDRQVEALDVRLPSASERARQNAQQQIRAAQDRLSVNFREQTSAAVAEGLKAANEAVTVLTATLTEARAITSKRLATLFQGELSGGTEALRAVEESLTRLEAVVTHRQLADAAQATQAVRQEATAARRRFEQAGTKEDLAGLQRANRVIAEIQQKVAALLSRFATATLRDRGVPERLEEATQLFIDGEFARVATALEDLSWSGNHRLAIHGYVLRAASLYRLFVRSGERDQALRARAAAAVQEARAHDPDFAPDRQLFGPRFLAFYRAAGSPAGAPPSPAAR